MDKPKSGNKNPKKPSQRDRVKVMEIIAKHLEKKRLAQENKKQTHPKP